jgi:hypothetical protein
VAQIFGEADLHVEVGGAGGGSFVVDLIADDGGIVFVVLENFADHALAVEAIGGIGEVGILAQAVVKILAAEPGDDDLGMLLIHPRGNGVGRRAQDHFNSGGVHFLDNAIHPRVFETSIFRLP